MQSERKIAIASSSGPTSGEDNYEGRAARLTLGTQAGSNLWQKNLERSSNRLCELARAYRVRFPEVLRARIARWNV
jgi:hypothetical protein